MLLNRDDSGLAKRLPYGNALRTRVSSQCLKRHWRIAEDPHALHGIDGTTAALRSRELVTRKVIAPLRDTIPGIGRRRDRAGVPDGRLWRQAVRRGRPVRPCCSVEPETRVARGSRRGSLADEVRRTSSEAAGKIAKETWKKRTAQAEPQGRCGENSNLPAGLEAALFGRMVTSDPEANITAPVHVAHAFTVHGEEAEMDYFTAVDDLSDDEPALTPYRRPS